MPLTKEQILDKVSLRFNYNVSLYAIIKILKMFKFKRREKEEGIDINETQTIIGAVYGIWYLKRLQSMG